MRRISNISASALDKAIAQYHSSKEKSIHRYLDLLDDLEYVLNDFYATVIEFNSFIKIELERDALFVKAIQNKYGLSYGGIVKRLEMTVPSKTNIYHMKPITLSKTNQDFTIAEIKENLELNHKIASRKIELNRTFLEPSSELLSRIDMNRVYEHGTKLRLANTNAMLLKKEILTFHKNKEVFLYSFITRQEYLLDVLGSILDVLKNIKGFSKQTVINDEIERKKIFQNFGLDYAPVYRLGLDFSPPAYQSINNITIDLSVYRDTLKRKLEMNDLARNKKPVLPVKTQEIPLYRQNLPFPLL